MHDLFLDYENLRQLYHEKDYLYCYTKDNFGEIVNQSFLRILDFYKNVEATCIDYEGLSLHEYMKVVASDFKQIANKYKKEMNELGYASKQLKEAIEEKSDLIKSFSKVKLGYLLALLWQLGFSILKTDREFVVRREEIINLPFGEDLSLVDITDEGIVFNPFLYQIFLEDTESFITFYINLQYNQDREISILEAWNIYKSEKIELV